MAKLLKMAQFLQQNRMSEVQVGRRRVKSSFNCKRGIGFNGTFQFFFQVLPGNQVNTTPLYKRYLFLYGFHCLNLFNLNIKPRQTRISTEQGRSGKCVSVATGDPLTLYFAYSTERVSRITVTRIWPG